MPEDARIAIGTAGERHAETLLRSGGYRILERNFRTREGELDLVAANRSALVFCEVKTRMAGSRHGPTPLEGIGPEKRRRVRRMARRWLSERESPGTTGIRFDAIGVTVTARGSLVSIEHVEDAFR
ncbi:MAG: YraN family protein [Thermoleophilaceae bacterium]